MNDAVAADDIHHAMDEIDVPSYKGDRTSTMNPGGA